MIIIDSHEPTIIKDSIALTEQCSVVQLNQLGYADYFWYDCADHTIQVERKQWGEILSGLDKVEEQLRRELPNASQTYLLIEGIAEPTLTGVNFYTLKNNFKLRHSYGTEDKPNPAYYSRVVSWLWKLDRQGVSILYSATQLATAITIVSAYRNSLKSDNTSLTRYIRPRPYLKAYNPHVLTLMGIEGAGLGEVKAKALIDRFSSVWNVLNATEKELCGVQGIGPTLARKISEAIGK